MRNLRYFGENLILVEGKDHIVGNFVQLIDRNYNQDPSGEGYVFDWDEFSGVIYSKVFFDVKALKAPNTPWHQPDPPLTLEEVWTFVKETYIKDEQERFPPKNTEPTHNTGGIGSDTDTIGSSQKES
jgi:hypothetical protein